MEDISNNTFQGGETLEFIDEHEEELIIALASESTNVS
jgi:hypothetical protein